MTRSRESAKSAGSRFERSIANHLAAHVDSRVDRRVRNGAKDRGDLAALRTSHGLRVTGECKDYGGVFKIGTWLAEVDVERGNDDTQVGCVFAKRRGVSYAGDQVVLMTVDDLVALLTGVRPTP